MRLYEELTRAWARDPGKPVIRFEGRDWTFTEIGQAVDRLVLRVEQESADPAARIGISAGDNLHRFLAIMACMHQARTFFTETPTDEFRAFKTGWTLTDTDVAQALHGPQAPGKAPMAYPSAGSTLRLAATSGTTGHPKWVAISVQAQWARICESRERIIVERAEANMFPCGPSAWFARFFGAAAHSPLVSLDTDADHTLGFLYAHPEANVYASPDQLIFLLKAIERFDKPKPELGRVTVVGGVVTPPVAQALARLGAQVFSQYASTECGHTAQTPFELLDDASWVLGHPAPGVEIQIRSQQGDVLTNHVGGLIWVKTPYMTNAYIDPETGASQFFPGGWFCSGDYGHLDAQGRLIYQGRGSDVVNLRGAKLDLRRVDDFFLSQPAIEDAAAFLMPGELGYQEVWVAVVTRQPLQAQNLGPAALARLGYLLAPARMIEVRHIPRTPTGKIRRQEMTVQMMKVMTHIR